MSNSSRSVGDFYQSTQTCANTANKINRPSLVVVKLVRCYAMWKGRNAILFEGVKTRSKEVEY